MLLQFALSCRCQSFVCLCISLSLYVCLCLSRQLQVRSAVMDSAALHAARTCCRFHGLKSSATHVNSRQLSDWNTLKTWNYHVQSEATPEAQSFHPAVARMPKASEQLGSSFMQAVCGVWCAHGFTVPPGPQDGPCRGQASTPLRWSGKDHAEIARIYACMKCIDHIWSCCKKQSIIYLLISHAYVLKIICIYILYIYIYAYTCTHTYIHIYIYTCSMHTYIQVHTHTHTHICIYIIHMYTTCVDDFPC